MSAQQAVSPNPPSTCWGDSTVHRLQRAPASSSVTFFTCSSWAAWTRGSSTSRAPLCCSPSARSHCSS